MSQLFDRMFPPIDTPEPQLAELVDGFTVDLPSRVEGSYLRADCTVRWVGPARTETSDRMKLRHIVNGHARVEAKRHTAAHLETAEIAINGRLSVVSPPSESRARSMTATVRLSADTEARESAAEWERLRTQMTVSRLSARLETERLRHLRDDIFAKPEVARTYWLDKHPNALDDVLNDRFERIAEKLTSAPQPSTLAVANVIREFLIGLGPEHKEVMMGLLHKQLADFGRADLALRLPPEPD